MNKLFPSFWSPLLDSGPCQGVQLTLQRFSETPGDGRRVKFHRESTPIICLKKITQSTNTKLNGTCACFTGCRHLIANLATTNFITHIFKSSLCNGFKVVPLRVLRGFILIFSISLYAHFAVDSSISTISIWASTTVFVLKYWFCFWT